VGTLKNKVSEASSGFWEWKSCKCKLLKKSSHDAVRLFLATF
jgi:hypothetical protein